MRRPCFTPGCPALVERGVQYCPHHTQQAARRDQEQRGTAAQRGYDAAWRQATVGYLQQHRWCARCASGGKQVRSRVVGHIQALRRGGARLDPANWQPLCVSCNKRQADAAEIRGMSTISFKGLDSETVPESALSA